MKGYQFISSKGQCVCSIRIAPHAIERLRQAMPDVKQIGEGRARGFLGRAELQELSAVRHLGYRPRAAMRLEAGETSYYFLIREKGHEALAVLTDDQTTGKLVWVTTYVHDEATAIRRSIGTCRMGRRKLKKFLGRKGGRE